VITLYRSMTSTLNLPIEGYEAPAEESPPVSTYLKHYLDVQDESLKAYKNSGSSNLPFTRVEKSIHGPASNECGVFGDFAMFCTLTGTGGEGGLVDISGIDSNGNLVDVSIDFVTTGGISYVTGTIGDVEVTVKRPDGVDTVAYVLSREAQKMSLRIVSPLQNDIMKDTKPCEVVIRPLVNQEMALNRGDAVIGKIINFGIYETTFTADQHAELDVFLKRACLLRSPIVTGMHEKLREATDALTSVKKTNPFGSDKITEKCATSVSDWRSPDYSLATEDCKREIASHCTVHPESPGCECWDKKSERYTTNACVSYRNMFSGKQSIDLQNLDEASLNTVKSHYNLFEAGPTAPASTTQKPKTGTREWYDYVLGTKS